METPERYPEWTVIAAKIVGGIAVFFSLRWIVNIFKGKDGQLDKRELKEIIAIFFFVCAGGYMLILEGIRDHEWHIYSEWYIAIVFGSLLTVLHLDSAMDKIVRILEAMIKLRRGGTPPSQPPTEGAQ